MVDTVYTEDVVTDMVERYVAVKDEAYEVRSEVVAEIADELGVSVFSVRSKLGSEKVYVAKAKADKAADSTSKDAYVKALSAIVGKDVKSFSKATKVDLKTVVDYITQASATADADAGVLEQGS